MGDITVRFIEQEDPAYEQERVLRYDLLRKPLGLPPGSEENAAESVCWHLIAEDAERVVGCVILRDDGDGNGQLMQMVVDAGCQGRGVGRLLVRALEARGRENGLNRIYMHARVVAQRFYARLGYTVYGDAFVEVGIPHCNMERAIGDVL